MKLCPPVLVYLAIALFSFGIAFWHEVALSVIAVKLFWVVLWTVLLQYLCSNNLPTVAWILVLLPYVIMLGTFAIAVEVLTKQKQ